MENNKNLEKEIEEILEIMETGELNRAQIFLCSSMLAEYKGKHFYEYLGRLRGLKKFYRDEK